MTRDTVLSIEAAIGGGSLALVSDGSVVLKWHSTEGKSRSEELLQRISEMIDAAGISKAAISRIAVSNGPGSYTGIRIGIATAMGLAKSLDIPCVGVSALRAIAARDDTKPCIVTVPIGRDGLCWQAFGLGVEILGTGDLDELFELIKSYPDVTVLAHSDAYNRLAQIMEVENKIVDVGRDIAATIGLGSRFLDDGLIPFYARDIYIAKQGENVTG